MPSTNFENSALKMSFSLSSLPVTETPEKGAIKPREFNSLKKKRRESLKRLSWGSSASEHRDKDEFWSSAIVESSYNFIMDNQLIDNCQDANCELSSDTNIWSIKELDAHFSELYSWLNSIQEKIYGHEDNVTDKTLRAICKTKLLEKQEFYNIFNEQGNKLIAKHPELKERLNWHLNFLGNKWEVLQSVLKSSDPEESDTIDIEREVKCLKNWVRNQFKSLQPLSFQKRWSRSEIETKAMEHKVFRLTTHSL
ncbi:PREDICTED: uncharacterized protein LOC108561554 [Nicrophorus vespilloides]|uniref:Uncharacterized protein LOC108561554 n=1 Tax=Nicrophorus vespilloides TaxID=110193 RepID=A0ABM1MKD8_NICVS|nr:PREDICTED: uncharacterized protein LOC108561554 [Nicrophorus vespilloides]